MLVQHPANLLLRFVLEIVALVGIGQWGWEKFQGPPRIFFAFGLPLLFTLLWIIFATPGEPGRNIRSLVPVPGRVRLLLEAFLFFFATWCFFASGRLFLAMVVAFALLLHYFWSADRVAWLMKN